MPNLWGKGGIYEGKYKRHSVDHDVNFFIGWNKLEELFDAFETRKLEGFEHYTKHHKYCDVGLVAFKVAGRITEALRTRAEWFTIYEHERVIVVRDYPILKRYKAVDVEIKCKRCKVINNKYETACTACGANLITAGTKHYTTVPVIEYRQPFFIKIDEMYSDRLIELIKNTQSGLLFPSPDKRRKDMPYTRAWAYNFVKNYGKVVNLDNLYNHYFRAQRLMQLRVEAGFTKEDLKMFTAIKSDKTLDHYIKDIQSYTRKLLNGVDIPPEIFAKMVEKTTNSE
jgi:hypothetical protein